MKNLKNNKRALILSLTLISVLLWILFDFFTQPPLKKENVLESIAAPISIPHEIKTIEPLPTEILSNPFEQNPHPLATNNLWPNNSEPSDWRMLGLLKSHKKTWAILSTPDDTIFYLNQHNKKTWAITNLDLSGLTMTNKKTKETVQIPYRHTETPTETCAEEDCFLISAEHIPTDRLIDIMGQFENANLVTQPGIQTETSIELNNTSWEAALDVILKSQGLAQWTVDNSSFIGTSADIIRLEKEAAAVTQEQQLATPLSTQIISLHYLSAEKLIKNLGDNKTLLSPRGHLSADPNKNAILIQDLPEKVNNLNTFIKALDTPSKQITIQAYVMSVDEHDEEEIGTRLNFATGANNETPASNISPSDQLHMDLPAPNTSASTFGLMIFKISKNTLLNLELSALENEGLAEMIASPHLITANQQTAMIESGEEIPYQESSRSGGTTAIFKKAVLKLEVTPQITSPDNILLHIQVNQDQPTQKSVQGVPTISTRQINTQVFVRSGETIVLGGIYEMSESNNDEHVPFLGKIPLLGWLFHHEQKAENKRQLLIFVTPTIAT